MIKKFDQVKMSSEIRSNDPLSDKVVSLNLSSSNWRIILQILLLPILNKKVQVLPILAKIIYKVTYKQTNLAICRRFCQCKTEFVNSSTVCSISLEISTQNFWKTNSRKFPIESNLDQWLYRCTCCWMLEKNSNPNPSPNSDPNLNPN